VSNSETDREFRLEVLRLTLETGSAGIITNPLEHAEKNLQWCLQPLDKPQARETQAPSKKPGQAA
tara:strand:- start:96 stop:290 length:195 start_codon:yes stop_codon:yes gene_type:complete